MYILMLYISEYHMYIYTYIHTLCIVCYIFISHLSICHYIIAALLVYFRYTFSTSWYMCGTFFLYFGTQYRIVGRYIHSTVHWQILTDIGQILTNIDQILMKNVNKILRHVFFQKGMSTTKKKPAALVSVANMVWGYRYWRNIDKYWLLNIIFD